MMMLREIADRFEEMNDTWRDETPAQQSADLALDGLLLELDQLDATDEVDLLRGLIELLMDQIELVIGPVTVTDDDGAVDDI